MAKLIYYATLGEARDAANRRHLLPAAFALTDRGWCIVPPQRDDPPVPPMVIMDFDEDEWDKWASTINGEGQ